MGKEDEIAKVVRVIHDGILKYGIGAIEKKLRELDSIPKLGGRHQLIKTKILREISSAYGMSPKTIISSRERGNTTQAKVTAIILFHIHLGVTQKKIATMLGYDPPIVSARISVLKKINCDEDGMPIHESERRFEKVYDKNFMRNFSAINIKIKQYVKTQIDG